MPTLGMSDRASPRGSSEFSYTLYLMHFPFLTVCVLAGLAPYRFQPTNAAGIFLYFGLLIAVIIWSFGFWWCFERNTDKLYECLSKRLRFPNIGQASLLPAISSREPVLGHRKAVWAEVDRTAKGE